MLDVIVDFYEKISIIDLIYLILTILSLIKCYKKGFVLSILSMAKWLLAYIITLIIFPRAKPYLKDVIDNEYVLDVGLGISIFIVVNCNWRPHFKCHVKKHSFIDFIYRYSQIYFHINLEFSKLNRHCFLSLQFGHLK